MAGHPIRPPDELEDYLASIDAPVVVPQTPPAPAKLPVVLVQRVVVAPLASRGLARARSLLATPRGRRLVAAGVISAVAATIALLLAAASAHAENVCWAKPSRGGVAIQRERPVADYAVPPAVKVSPFRVRPRRAPAERFPWNAPPVVYIGLAALGGMLFGRRFADDKGRALLDATTRERSSLGAASITGRVRENNQDRVETLRLADLDLILMADGLGGLRRGGEAAELVLAYARERLEDELPEVVAARVDGVRSLLVEVIWGAAVKLACVAAHESWGDGEPGLRTTLVLVAASRDYYCVAWIGDGGVFVVRDSGEVVPLLEPHKAPETPDLLLASLGPSSEGRPAWCVAAREQGDLLFVATDGVADTFDEGLVLKTREALRRAEGDATLAAKGLLDELASEEDEDGSFRYRDNLTVALLTEPP